MGGGARYDPAGMRDNWDLAADGMKAKANRKCHVSFFAWTAETRSTIKVLFFLFHIRLGVRVRVGVGVGARVGVNQEAGVGVGTASHDSASLP